MKSLYRALAILGFVAAMLSSAGPASAQQACATREAATKTLEKQFDEKVVGRGLATTGKAMLELFVSANGSWTVVVSDSNGRSCILATGESWQRLPVNLGDPA